MTELKDVSSPTGSRRRLVMKKMLILMCLIASCASAPQRPEHPDVVCARECKRVSEACGWSDWCQRRLGECLDACL